MKNSLDLLDVLDAMQTRTTPHFAIRYDKADAHLVPYVAAHLEAVYADSNGSSATSRRSQRSWRSSTRAQGQSGHAWFRRG